MLINKEDPLLHVIRLEDPVLKHPGLYTYLCTADDVEMAISSVRNALNSGTFIHTKVQMLYDDLKERYGKAAETCVTHQFVQHYGKTGFIAGHTLIVDNIISGNGLTWIANIGDWLSCPGYFKSPETGSVIIVTDISKYFQSNDYFESDDYPIYSLDCPDGDVKPAILETHELPRADECYYSSIIIAQNNNVMRLSYNPVSDSTALPPGVINKPIKVAGLRYSSLNNMCRVNNIPLWYAYGLATSSPANVNGDTWELCSE
ncbi:hypothetical protein ABN214_15550 [Proteus terrae]|uniref:hypothetical protein n=1 Tax=Proteus terrae TaxID=1574161 RepID=UPI0032DABDD7